MVALLLVPVVISLLLLGAHFLRAGAFAMVALVLVLLALLGVRRGWAARLAQAALVLGAAEWIRTTIRLVMQRSEAGQPVVRLVVILGSVTLLTVLSALVFRSARLHRWYSPEPEGAATPDDKEGQRVPADGSSV